MFAAVSAGSSAPICSVSTRSSEVDPLTGTVIFPDLRIDATTADGESIVVFAEHKWDSPCRVDQLQNYRRIGEHTGPKTRLAFVGAHRDQVLSAKEHVDVSLYWENAYELLESVADQSEVLEDFLYFIKSQGLGPMAAITPEKLKAFVEGNDLPFQLSVFCRKLADEYTWKPGRSFRKGITGLYRYRLRIGTAESQSNFWEPNGRAMALGSIRRWQPRAGIAEVKVFVTGTSVPISS